MRSGVKLENSLAFEIRAVAIKLLLGSAIGTTHPDYITWGWKTPPIKPTLSRVALDC